MIITNQTNKILRLEVNKHSNPRVILELEPKDIAQAVPECGSLIISHTTLDKPNSFVKWLLIDLNEAVKDIKMELRSSLDEKDIELVSVVLDKHIKGVKDKWK